MLLLWLTLTLSLGMIGVGVAAWQEGIAVGGVVSTGYIDPCFESVEPTEGQGEAFISGDGKTLTFSIEEAVPGQAYLFEYTVENRGSVPVRLTPDNSNTFEGITVTNEFPEDSIGGNGGSAKGMLTISLCGEVPDAPKGASEFELGLLFRQWCAAP
ncbi:MAG: hypothetical protein GX883_09135 [Firmicutes bacterium]|nr:hypothetical protein [Bacillota bacterium]